MSTFFEQVTTPDSLQAVSAATVTVSQGTDTTLTVKKGDTVLESGAKVNNGDQLLITVQGGTVTVNGTPFISGNIHVVNGDVEVVSSKSE